MSGGSQHNPNGRQSQLGSGWSPLQLQVANLLARAPQAHMASDRGVTWHTPTPPPHLYHVPAPSPPDPLQALKSAGGNSVFRHTATPPELYRHTPTPPDKHHMRHTPSPGDIKANAALPPVDLYQHLAPSRADKLRADELMAYTRVGVDLSLGGGRAANGAATSPAPPAPPALSVRDAPTINSLIARAQPRHPHARVDALLERLVPSPVSPHSVIVHSRAAPTPSPPSSNEDSADSCGAPPGSKRKRKPERTVRVAAAPPPPAPLAPVPAPLAPAPVVPPAAPRVSPPPSPPPAPAPAPPPRENGDAPHVKTAAPESRPASPRPDQPHARRKTRSGSAETIDDIAAMIADTDRAPPPPLAPPPPASPAAAVTVDKLRSVLASPETARAEPGPDAEPTPASPPGEPASPAAAPAPPPAPAAAPRRRSARTSNPEAPNVPVESPSEGKPAEPEASDARTAEPAAASFVEVENQLEKMFAGLEEEPAATAPLGAGARARAGPQEGGAQEDGRAPAAQGPRGARRLRLRQQRQLQQVAGTLHTDPRPPRLSAVGERDEHVDGGGRGHEHAAQGRRGVPQRRARRAGRARPARQHAGPALRRHHARRHVAVRLLRARPARRLAGRPVRALRAGHGLRRVQVAGRGHAAALLHRRERRRRRGVVPRGLRRVGARAGGVRGAPVGPGAGRVGRARGPLRDLRGPQRGAGVRGAGLPRARPPALRARGLGAARGRVPRAVPAPRLAPTAHHYCNIEQIVDRFPLTFCRSNLLCPPPAT